MAKGQGANWKKVNPNSLSKANRKLYDDYKVTIAKAKGEAKALKDAMSSEWYGKYPAGKDGMFCSFNVMNGTVLYVMNDRKMEDDGDLGDNPF